MFGPNARITQPDPILTQCVQDQSDTGGWLFGRLCANTPTTKDYVRWFKKDAKTLGAQFADTRRSPGGMPNLVKRPKGTWATSDVGEDALRIEIEQEAVDNAGNPAEPFLDAALKIGNALQYALDKRVAALYDPSASHFTTDVNKIAASGLWATTTSKMRYDVERAKALVKGGANFIRVPRGKWPGILDADEIKANHSGFYNPLLLDSMTGYPMTFMGLVLVIGTARVDVTYTGAYTPSDVWDDATLNLDDTVHVGYSPTLGGQNLIAGDSFARTFGNQKGGSDFEVMQRPDNDFDMNPIHHVWSRFRRSDPEIVNPRLVVAITGI